MKKNGMKKINTGFIYTALILWALTTIYSHCMGYYELF